VCRKLKAARFVPRMPTGSGNLQKPVKGSSFHSLNLLGVLGSIPFRPDD